MSRPFALVTPTLDGDVLRVLTGADHSFTTSDVQRLVPGRSHRGIHLVLERLADQGVVTRQQAGRTVLYRLNRDHLATDALLLIAALRQRMLERLREHVSQWKHPPVYAALFGSAVTDHHSSASDIDIFLVRPTAVDADDWADEVLRLVDAATRWTGNDVRPLIYSQERVGKRAATEPLLRVIADSGVTFFGPPAWLRTVLGPRTPSATARP